MSYSLIYRVLSVRPDFEEGCFLPTKSIELLEQDKELLVLYHKLEETLEPHVCDLVTQVWYGEEYVDKPLVLSQLESTILEQLENLVNIYTKIEKRLLSLCPDLELNIRPTAALKAVMKKVNNYAIC